jgi:hypothetical protein
MLSWCSSVCAHVLEVTDPSRAGATFGSGDAAFEELVDDLLEHRQHQPVNTGDLQR